MKITREINMVDFVSFVSNTGHTILIPLLLLDPNFWILKVATGRYNSENCTIFYKLEGETEFRYYATGLVKHEGRNKIWIPNIKESLNKSKELYVSNDTLETIVNDDVNWKKIQLLDTEHYSFNLKTSQSQEIRSSFECEDGTHVVITRTLDAQSAEDFTLWHGNLDQLFPVPIHKYSRDRYYNGDTFFTLYGYLNHHDYRQDLKKITETNLTDFNFENDEAGNRIRLILMF